MKTNLKYTLPMLALAATGALCSCSDDVESWVKNGEPDPAKELISFTGESGTPITRATGFGGSSNTQIVMRIKSEDSQTDGGHTKGADRYTRTVASATPTCSSAHNSITLEGTHSDVVFTGENYRYWDDAYGRYGKLSVYAVAVPGYAIDEVLSPGVLTEGTTFVNNTKWFTETTENEKFTWTLPNEQTADVVAKKDICFSNNIRLSTTDYAIKDSEKGIYRPAYSSGSDSWSYSLVKGQMQWNAQTTGATAGKFDQGHFVFYHALSKVTINLTEATNTADNNRGFNNGVNTDFKFADGTNVSLLSFPYENVFDLSTGQWADYNSSTNKTDNISKLNETTTTFENISTHSMVGLVIPGKNLYEDTNNSLRFIIDGNEYFVTGNKIAEAIRAYYAAILPNGEENPNANSTLAEFTTMKQGEHYEINITVSKSKIEAITAQLVDWEKVSANITDPSNAYVNILVEERGGGQYKEYVTNGYAFDLYRAAETENLNSTVSGESGYYNTVTKYNWNTGYITGDVSTGADKASKSYANSVWSTQWVWPDNKTYYHFRMVGNTEGTESTPSNVSINKDASNGDYFNITSGKITDSQYKDYTWAAPFVKNDRTKWYYGPTTHGFDGKDDKAEDSHQIYKAIGATNDKINLMMFHMTSQLFINVKTTTDLDKVALRTGTDEPYNQTKVELLHFYKDGTVRVGNGLVLATTTELTTNDEMQFVAYTPEVEANGSDPAVAAKSEFQYGVVPQILTGTHESNAYTVGVRITTPDDNQYVVEDISTVLAATADISSTNLYNPYAESASGSEKYMINRWYPGYRYTYTVTIKKTGIVSITAQLVDWETVTGDLGEINLEGTN